MNVRHPGLNAATLTELVDTWEATAGTGERGAAFRECADAIRSLLHLHRPQDCPRAPAPFRYCPDCDGTFPCQLPSKSAAAAQIAALSGAADIMAERRRQIECEGWSPEHDDQYRKEELLLAAVAYVQEAGRSVRQEAPVFWPWDASWWKPKGRRADLVRAGALIAAEIDRLDRADLKQ